MAPTLCRYDLRIYLFELGKGATSKARIHLFRADMCGGGVRSILLLPLVARCIQ